MNLRNKLLSLSAMGLGCSLIVALVGIWGEHQLERAHAEQIIINTALKNHLEGDMMHDAIRADVLKVILSVTTNNKEGIAEARDELNQHANRFTESLQHNSELPLNDSLKNKLKKARPALDAYIQAGKDMVVTATNSSEKTNDQLKLFMAAFTQLEEVGEALSDDIQAVAMEASKNNAKVTFYSFWILIACLLVSAVVIFIYSARIIKSMNQQLGADPSEVQVIAQRIAKGDVNFEIDASNAAKTSLLASMADMVKSLRDADHVARESFRIKTALDKSSTAFLMCDNQGNINYANDSSIKLLRDNEVEIRKVLPQFSMATIMGANISIFHSKPAYQKNILDGLTGTHTAKITVGTRIFKLMMTPFIDHTNTRLGTVVEWQDLTEEVAADQQKTRILESLDCTSTNVMIADNARNIIYMNRSVEKMLRVAENDLRQVLPAFSVDKVIGSNMDIFHKNPAHQMKLLETLTSAYTGNITVGKRSFRLIANPIFAKDGTRIGSVVEWLDRTAEVAAEKEVNQLVEKAVQGNFTARIATEDKNGFFLKLAQDLNELVTTADKGLNDVARVLGAIAKGNLTEKIDAEYQGTFGELKNYCNQTTANLTEMLSDIRTAADTIFTASSEIAQGNADLSSRTEQQAANLEETASSMEELTSTVKLNADNAKQANVLAEQASTVASNGGSLIQQVVTTMSEINQSSQKISDIIGVIDGIAFQTNILALNAAVEAARAGDQGRGFAVVASEVRTLAQRSANAAKDIKGLISDSVHKIESGNALVSKSGDTMKEIVTAIKRVNDIMAEIAAASAEQSTGIEEVSTAVSQMDEMTQQNAALVEQAAAAAESMQSQADQLTHSVAQFQLSDDQVRSPMSVKRPLTQSPAAEKKAPTVSKKLSPLPSVKDDEWEQF
jgi:methyl-accepting chemotaxis protein